MEDEDAETLAKENLAHIFQAQTEEMSDQDPLTSAVLVDICLQVVPKYCQPGENGQNTIHAGFSDEDVRKGLRLLD